jgi:choline kinase
MAKQCSNYVRDAIVLAAGNGDRFHNDTPHSKLLTRVAGIPLLVRTLTSAHDAGITDAHVVLGYDADAVRAVAASEAPPGLTLHFHLNEDWREENGVSVLAARDALEGQPFAILMGDHLFESDVLARMLQFERAPGESLLCVDEDPVDPAVAEEATRVRLDDGRVTAIGKSLDPYDGLDTGLFVCDPSIFASLAESCAAGDSTLSGGVRRLAALGAVRGVDIGRARWCDIDTIEDLDRAERNVGHESSRSDA